jgi:hypothetical protein
VSLNEQCPFSFAQNVHDESGGTIPVEEAVTTAVAADVAAADPLRLLAVTMMRSV